CDPAARPARGERARRRPRPRRRRPRASWWTGPSRRRRAPRRRRRRTGRRRVWARRPPASLRASSPRACFRSLVLPCACCSSLRAPTATLSC
ncbi:Hypothetical Protein FCC1311_034272, partial [Hondaea fermentalgiana]